MHNTTRYRDLKGSIVISDFVLARVNGNMTQKDQKHMVKKLHKAEGFAVIMPRSMVRHLQCPCQIGIENDELLQLSSAEQSDGASALGAYAKVDSVVVYGGVCIDEEAS